MTEPIIFEKSLSIAPLAALQALLPPAVTVGSLYILTLVYDVDFTDAFVVLAVLVATLSAVLLQPSRSVASQLAPRTVPVAVGIILRWLALLAILLTVGYVTKFSHVFSRRVLLTWAVLTPALMIVGTVGVDELMRRLLMSSAHWRRVVFAGCNEISRSLAERIAANPELRMQVYGFCDDRSAERLGFAGGPPLLGRLADLSRIVKSRAVDVIFVALPIGHVQRVTSLLDELRDTTASVYYVPDILAFDLIQARPSEILGIPVVAMCETPFYGYRGVVKRLTDVIIASAILVPALPVMVAIAAAVRFSSPGPVLFRQRRYGLDGQEIVVYKFRTMTVTEDGARIVQARREDERVTPVGRFLRRYSLDELPQLINVLQGRMSVVGPRPHAVAHNEEYRKLIKGYMVRHKVLPGITGLAQVNGCRGETARLEDMQARVEYDLDYLRHWSPLLDLKILGLTCLQLFRDQKAY